MIETKADMMLASRVGRGRIWSVPTFRCTILMIQVAVVDVVILLV